MSRPGTEPENLESCPNCGREDMLIVAHYKDGDAIVEISLECEGCCSVVTELEKDDLARMRFTEAGRRILERVSEM